MKFKHLFLSLLLLFSYSAFAKNKVELTSPRGNLKVIVNVDKDISYDVFSGNDRILHDCAISMNINNRVIGEKPSLKRLRRTTINETITPVVAIKNRKVVNHCNVVLLYFKGDYGVEFRAYDNGIAYRFMTAFKGNANVFDEKVDIQFKGDPVLTMSKTPSFRSSYENPYAHIKASEYRVGDNINYLPLYAQTESGYNVLFSETDLYDYPCLFLKSDGKGGLQSTFPRCPIEFGPDNDRSLKTIREASYMANTKGSRTFPWRFFVISKDARDIIANQLEFVLATPNVLKDVSWIRPGQVSWDWWNGRGAWGVDFRAGCNEETYKYFIDFASKYKIPYIILDEGWSASTSDPLHSNEEIDIHRLIEYGKQKGVGLIVWLTWLAVEKNMNLFEEYEKWGIAGIKVDFMDRSDQWMVNYYERVAKEAGRHHLLVDFHGAFKPAGLERKYPNILSYEGVLGLEQGGLCKPENSNWLPFIRNAVGPMDFTPGGLTNIQPHENHSTWAIPMASGTRAYQMALYLIFESGIQMLADSPKRYEQNPDCTQFLTQVPVEWDETRVLKADPGKYVVIARRSGSKWFVGAITDTTPRDFEIKLDFLQKSGTVTAFADGINADRQAMDYKKTTQQVSPGETLSIHMLQNGGYAAVIE